MAVESKRAIRYCVKTMKKPIFLHKSVFCEKNVYGFSFMFGRQHRAEMEICGKKRHQPDPLLQQKIGLFGILASRPRKLLMVSASFWTTKPCKTEICQKGGTSQIHACRETKAFCNTCKQAEKTVYGLSFIFGRQNRAETGIFEKNPTEGIAKNIAKFRVSKVWTLLNAMQKRARRCTEKSATANPVPLTKTNKKSIGAPTSQCRTQIFLFFLTSARL